MTAENLLKSGIQAVKQQQYKAAIQALMACCQSTDRQSKLYFQAQMWLVRAYYDGGQAERAIALCQQLSTDAPPQVQTWARNLLPTLSAAPAIGPETAGSAATDARAAIGACLERRASSNAGRNSFCADLRFWICDFG